jgi:hypothetical protein
VSLQGRLAHFGFWRSRCPPWSQGCSARPPIAAGVWYKHLDGRFPVQGVRFGDLKSVPFELQQIAAGAARPPPPPPPGGLYFGRGPCQAPCGPVRPRAAPRVLPRGPVPRARTPGFSARATGLHSPHRPGTWYCHCHWCGVLLLHLEIMMTSDRRPHSALPPPTSHNPRAAASRCRSTDLLIPLPLLGAGLPHASDPG